MCWVFTTLASKMASFHRKCDSPFLICVLFLFYMEKNTEKKKLAKLNHGDPQMAPTSCFSNQTKC